MLLLAEVQSYLTSLFKKNKPITITDKKMTRFNISLDEGVDAVMWSLKTGGKKF